MFFFFRYLHHNNQIVFKMRRLFSIALVVMAFLCSSCDDVMDSLKVKQELDMPKMEFRLDRQQQKDGLGDVLMDETISFNLDSMMAEWGYSTRSLAEYLDKSMLRNMTFQLKDSSLVKDFDFIDSARMTFSTPSIAEQTVAMLSPKEERKASSRLELQLAAMDVTRFIRSQEHIRVRIYGKADMDKLPSEVSYVEVLVAGAMQMELKPKL